MVANLDADAVKAAVVSTLRAQSHLQQADLVGACAAVLIREASVVEDVLLGRVVGVDVEVVASPAAYVALDGFASDLGETFVAALRAALPEDVWIEKLLCTLQDATPSDGSPWMTASPAPPPEVTVAGDVHNQGMGATLPHVWNGLRFRSASEVCIAGALERAGVLFLPNCLARLGGAGNRQNREADFLVCHEGHWGILEVDGAPYHPPSRTVQDHARDRLFRAHGVRVVEHFDADECRERPDSVVCQFLDVLRHG